MQAMLKLNPVPAEAEVHADPAAIDRAMVRARHERAAALRWWAGLLSGWLRTRVVEPLRRARQRRVDLDVLLTLDDRTLADIGLQRGQIKAMVHSGVPVRRSIPQPAIGPAPATSGLAAADPAPAAVAREADDFSKAA